ncbi:MAG: CPBP family intramembrane glutamic endopeptidase [Candidatus Omnitrophota bacterium]
MTTVEFFAKERVYVLCVIFILACNIMAMFAKRAEAPIGEKTGARAQALSEKTGEHVSDENMTAGRLRQAMKKRAGPMLLVNSTGIFILLAFSVGFIVDIYFIMTRPGGRVFLESGPWKPAVAWSMIDVVRVAVLFMFFGYVLVFIESALSEVFPVLKNSHAKMMINSSVLDICAVIFIIQFTVVRYKEPWSALGVSMKSFSRNVFYGILGYVASIPIFISVIIVVYTILRMAQFDPPRQPVVSLFLKETNTNFLIYSSLFAAVVGPFIEELFFRAFLYGAVKKKIGIVRAMFITSVLFALLHANIVGFFPILALGMILAYLYEKTGTLVAPITVHVCHNLTMLYLVFVARQIGSI